MNLLPGVIAMKRSSFLARHALLPLLAALVLAGCATAPAELPQPLQPPAQCKEAGERWPTAAPAEAQDRGAWWKVFADPVLDGLVERAGINNTSIHQAAARLAQARALARSAEADRAPQIGVGAGASRLAGAGAPGGPGAATLISAGANLSYEVD